MSAPMATPQVRLDGLSAIFYAAEWDVTNAKDPRARNAAIRRLNSVSAEMRKLEAEQDDTDDNEFERMAAAAVAIQRLRGCTCDLLESPAPDPEEETS